MVKQFEPARGYSPFAAAGSDWPDLERRNMGDTPELIEQLLAGPYDTRLTTEDLAYLEAHLRNYPFKIAWYQQANRGMKCPELDRHKKLKTIRDFNRNLQRSAAVTDGNRKRWVWDLRPLDKDAWGNREWSDDGTPAGQTIVISHAQTRFIFATFDGDKKHGKRTLSRRFYIPTSDDLELLRVLYPQDDPLQPAWYVIKTDLVAAGYDADKLNGNEAPVLLKLLGKATRSALAEGSDQANDSPAAMDAKVEAADDSATSIKFEQNAERGEGQAKLIAAMPKPPKENSGDDLTPPKRTKAKKPDVKPKRGRPVDEATIRRADFAKPWRDKGKTWAEIAAMYSTKYPRDIDASPDTLRLAFQRQYPEPK